MIYVWGLNDKVGIIIFKVNVLIIIYLVIDFWYLYIYGDEYEKIGDLVMLGGCYKFGLVKFLIYWSCRIYGFGLVIVYFSFSWMIGIFFRDNVFDVCFYVELKVIFFGIFWEISMVWEGEKFSINWDCYRMEDIFLRYYGLMYFWGLNDEKIISFYVNILVIVYVVIDFCYNCYIILLLDFKVIGERIIYGGCYVCMSFLIYERKYFKGGIVIILFIVLWMLIVMVKFLMMN